MGLFQIKRRLKTIGDLENEVAKMGKVFIVFDKALNDYWYKAGVDFKDVIPPEEEGNQFLVGEFVGGKEIITNKSFEWWAENMHGWNHGHGSFDDLDLESVK